MDKAYFVLTFLAEIQQLSYLLFQQRGIPICCCMLKDAGDDVFYLKQSGRQQRLTYGFAIAVHCVKVLPDCAVLLVHK